MRVARDPLLLTGAGGFLGRAIVKALGAADWDVRAITRRHQDGLDAPQTVIDLGSPEAREALDVVLDGVACVIHTAVGSGRDADHARDTVAATQTLIGAMLARADPPRLVLVSSMAVYGYTAMPAWAKLDETTPLEPEPALRDAYCRAKLAQEALARQAAQRQGLKVWALRPGVLVGRGRERTARLGFALGPVLLMPGGAAPIPLIDVDTCASAVLLAAARTPTRSDYPIVEGDGCYEAVNLIGDEQPSQADYAARIVREGRLRRSIRIPYGVARASARALGLLGAVAPDLVRRAPGPLRLETFDARFKPLRFSRARAEDRLGVRPTVETAES